MLYCVLQEDGIIKVRPSWRCWCSFSLLRCNSLAWAELRTVAFSPRPSESSSSHSARRINSDWRWWPSWWWWHIAAFSSLLFSCRSFKSHLLFFVAYWESGLILLQAIQRYGFYFWMSFFFGGLLVFTFLSRAQWVKAHAERILPIHHPSHHHLTSSVHQKRT